MLKRRYTIAPIALTLTMALFGCGSASAIEATSATSAAIVETKTQQTHTTEDADASVASEAAATATVALQSAQDVTITEAGTYAISGSATDATIVVDAGEAEVTLVLSGVTIENADAPAIYVKGAGKVWIELADGTTNALAVTGTFAADGDTQLDGVIFSRDDVVIRGGGSLTVSSTKHGVVSKDDLTVESGTLAISVQGKGLQANDEVTICGGSITIDAAEGIEATVVTIQGGSVQVSATDDGINATARSDKDDIGVPTIYIEGGELTIDMAAGDTDALDANGNLYVSGGTVTISGQFAFDYDGEAALTGGTVLVNGEQVSSIENSMMGGMGGFAGGQGGPAGGLGGQGGPWAR